MLAGEPVITRFAVDDSSDSESSEAAPNSTDPISDINADFEQAGALGEGDVEDVQRAVADIDPSPARRQDIEVLLEDVAASAMVDPPAADNGLVKQLQIDAGLSDQAFQSIKDQTDRVINGEFPDIVIDDESLTEAQKIKVKEQKALLQEQRRVMTEKLRTTNSGNMKNVHREILIYLLWTRLHGLEWWVTEYNLLLYLEWTRKLRDSQKSKGARLAYGTIKFTISAVCGHLFQYQFQLNPERVKINPQSTTAVKRALIMISQDTWERMESDLLDPQAGSNFSRPQMHDWVEVMKGCLQQTYVRQSLRNWYLMTSMLANVRRGDDAVKERLCWQSLQILNNRDVHGTTVQLLSTIVRHNKVNKTGVALHNFIAPHKNPLMCACLAHAVYLWWLFDAEDNPNRIAFPDLLAGSDEPEGVSREEYRATHWYRFRLIHSKSVYQEISDSATYNVYVNAFKKAGIVSDKKVHAARKSVELLKEAGVSDTGLDGTGHWNHNVRGVHYNNGQQTDAILAAAGFSPNAKYYFIPELSIKVSHEMDELRLKLIGKYFPNMVEGALRVRNALKDDADGREIHVSVAARSVSNLILDGDLSWFFLRMPMFIHMMGDDISQVPFVSGSLSQQVKQKRKVGAMFTDRDWVKWSRYVVDEAEKVKKYHDPMPVAVRAMLPPEIAMTMDLLRKEVYELNARVALFEKEMAKRDEVAQMRHDAMVARMDVMIRLQTKANEAVNANALTPAHARQGSVVTFAAGVETSASRVPALLFPTEVTNVADLPSIGGHEPHLTIEHPSNMTTTLNFPQYTMKGRLYVEYLAGADWNVLFHADNGILFQHYIRILPKKSGDHNPLLADLNLPVISAMSEIAFYDEWANGLDGRPPLNILDEVFTKSWRKGDKNINKRKKYADIVREAGNEVARRRRALEMLSARTQRGGGAPISCSAYYQFLVEDAWCSRGTGGRAKKRRVEEENDLQVQEEEEHVREDA